MMQTFSTFFAGVDSPVPEFFGISLGVFLPFFFVGMWLFISFVLSRLGWSRFATAYAASIRPPGGAWSVPTASFGEGGAASYSGVVRAIPTHEGLYLYTFILFRAYHQPFLLPWSSIEKVEPYACLWARGYILRVRDDNGSFSMHVKASMEPELRRFIPRLFEKDGRVLCYGINCHRSLRGGFLFDVRKG